MSAPPYPVPAGGYNPGYSVPQNNTVSNTVPQSEQYIPENPENNHDPSHLPHDAELPTYEWATSTYENI